MDINSTNNKKRVKIKEVLHTQLSRKLLHVGNCVLVLKHVIFKYFEVYKIYGQHVLYMYNEHYNLNNSAVI